MHKIFSFLSHRNSFLYSIMRCFVVVVLKLLFCTHLKGMKLENIQKLKVVLI